MPPFVDRNHERLQLRALLLRPGEFHALEDGQLKVVALQALAEVAGVAPHDHLPGHAGLRFHERSERLQDYLHHTLGRIARQTARQADADWSPACFRRFVAARPTPETCP